jgi:hypothetical protein
MHPERHNEVKLSPKFDDSYREGIHLLVDSHDTAQAKGLPIADFAIEIEDLHRVGLAKFQLRRLLAEKFIQCGVEDNGSEQIHRQIRWCSQESYALPVQGCVRLTPEGVTWARAFLAAAAPSHHSLLTTNQLLLATDDGLLTTSIGPEWNESTKELTHMGKAVLQIRQQAKNEEPIIQAFHDVDWAKLIDNPLPYDNRKERVEHAREGVKKLNRRLRRAGSILHFFISACGDKLGWEFRTPSRNGVMK